MAGTDFPVVLLDTRECGAYIWRSVAGWSSLVARWAHNPKVGGSNPPPATKPKLYAISCLNRVERAANQSQLAPISSHSSRCRYAAFSAARSAPGELESIISTTLLFAV